MQLWPNCASDSSVPKHSKQIKDLTLHNLTSKPSTTSHYKVKFSRLDYSIIKKLQEETRPYVMKIYWKIYWEIANKK